MHAASLSSDVVGARLRRLNWLVRAGVVEAKLRELERAVKAGFDPNQPRVPAGSPDGGEWTGTGGAGGGSQVAQSAPRSGGAGQVRLRSGRLVSATPAQQARHVAAVAEAARLRRQVQEIDPTWKPSPSMSSDTIEGNIAAAEGKAREAQQRLFELAQQPAENLIDAYRRQQGLDLFDEPNWSREQNTIAACNANGTLFMGVNSGALTYSETDRVVAQRSLDALVQNYPTVMNTEKVGGFPNNAILPRRSHMPLEGGTSKWRDARGADDRSAC